MLGSRPRSSALPMNSSIKQLHFELPASCSPAPQVPYQRSTGKQHTRPQQNRLADPGALLAGGTVPDWIASLRVLLRCDFALLLVHAHLKDLSQVQRLAVRGLRNLLPATESVGNDQGFFRRAAHGGKQHAFATGQGNFEVVPLFIAESTRHP